MASRTHLKNDVVQLNSDDGKLLSQSLFTKAIHRLLRDRLTMAALSVLLIIIIVSLLAPLIVEHILQVDPLRTNPRARFLPIGSEGHVLGTDDVGRDFLGRLLLAGGVSLRIGFLAAAVTLVIGLTFGMMAGYFGGLFDDFMIWIITTLNSLPQLYLLIAFSALLRPTAETLILVIAVTGWTGDTRLMRGQTIAIRELDYVLAARAIGASSFRILYSHILPNLISVMVISLAISIGAIILLEAALSFLGLGVQQPTPTWGNMLTEARFYFRRSWHLIVLPGLLISITVLCLYIIGDGIRDAFDPTVND
jgi:peptide/nickel transport system permease protein